MEETDLLTTDDLLDFLQQLQEEADDLVVSNVNCKITKMKYEIMLLICENAWHQAQVRAWIKLARENIYEKILDMDGDVV